MSQKVKALFFLPQKEKRIKTHIINYSKTRDTYIAYRKSGYSEYKKLKKEMRDDQIAKQNVESFYAAQQSWNQEENLKKKRQQQG